MAIIGKNWKNNKINNNQKINIFFSIVIILLVSILLLLILTLNNNKDYIKQVANNNINSVLIIECTYTDETISRGTGVVYGNGKVLSVAHLFDSNKEIDRIVAKKYNSQTEYELILQEIDENKDLALSQNNELTSNIKVENDLCQYGDKIIKIGNSLGYGISLDYGIVSNPFKTISIDGIERNLLQISMQIYSGDSGAPIFNQNGNLVGIVSFKTSTSISSHAELSYAVCSNSILEFINK